MFDNDHQLKIAEKAVENLHMSYLLRARCIATRSID